METRGLDPLITAFSPRMDFRRRFLVSIASGMFSAVENFSKHNKVLEKADLAPGEGAQLHVLAPLDSQLPPGVAVAFGRGKEVEEDEMPGLAIWVLIFFLFLG
ncbi:Hypothetical predicted protein [Olea europaea subsp. europaea]|uniref:Uncharacterized protein n=1 Tax=Olea europaea subsp. europaea TaxID=158383 RepID=A0A8S0T6P0_OLEEU|nr:Hypothetical predicted protein [Olea europaea subsp. europaea]